MSCSIYLAAWPFKALSLFQGGPWFNSQLGKNFLDLAVRSIQRETYGADAVDDKALAVSYDQGITTDFVYHPGG